MTFKTRQGPFKFPVCWNLSKRHKGAPKSRYKYILIKRVIKSVKLYVIVMSGFRVAIYYNCMNKSWVFSKLSNQFRNLEMIDIPHKMWDTSFKSLDDICFLSFISEKRKTWRR